MPEFMLMHLQTDSADCTISILYVDRLIGKSVAISRIECTGRVKTKFNLIASKKLKDKRRHADPRVGDSSGYGVKSEPLTD